MENNYPIQPDEGDFYNDPSDDELKKIEDELSDFLD